LNSQIYVPIHYICVKLSPSISGFGGLHLSNLHKRS